MHAAVVTSFDQPPTYAEVPAPAVRCEDHLVVDVLASGLHPRVRSQANGSHYTSTEDLPLVPGIDGVGRGPDGSLRYFILPDTAQGAMAEQTVVDPRRSIVLADDVDPVLLAAAMNPAMASWMALRRRIDFRIGQSVLVLAATGSAGSMAVQVARHLGAGEIVAAGRRPERLAELPADRTVSTLGAPDAVADRLGEAAADVDVVLDFHWGTPTAAAMTAVVTRRRDRGRPLSWVEIGSVAGPTAEIPAAALRAARLQIVGSGQGSVPTRDILAELPELAAQVTHGTFDVDARALPLSQVTAAWQDTAARQRVVLTP